jgi:hypothetical protein
MPELTSHRHHPRGAYGLIGGFGEREEEERDERERGESEVRGENSD